METKPYKIINRGKQLKDNVIYFKLILKATVRILLVIFYIQTQS